MTTLEQRNAALERVKHDLLYDDDSPALQALLAFLRAADKNVLSTNPTKYEVAALIDHAMEEPL